MENIPIEEDKSYINRLQQMKDIIKLSSIALILIVWSIVSFIAYQNKKLKEKISESQPSPTTNLTANWKTYRNEEYGFEFKYPSAWKYQEDNSRKNKDGFIVLIFPEHEIYNIVSLTVYKSNLSLDDFLKESLCGGRMECKTFKNAETVIFSNISAKKVEIPTWDETYTGAVFFSKNMSIFEISYVRQEESYYKVQQLRNYDVFAQILSTLRFNSGL